MADEQPQSKTAGEGLTLTKRSEGGPLYFVANRADGFGGRLAALLNAILAARELSGQAVLDWDRPMNDLVSPFHDVLSESETFSRSYVEKYRFKSRQLRSLTTVRPATIEIDRNDRPLVPAGTDAIVMLPNHIDRQFPDFTKRFPSMSYGEAFETIAFSAPLEQAKAQARAVSMDGGYAAVHLRAGDIIYGHLRSAGGYQNKIIPYHFADLAISKLQDDGNEILIFGQDRSLCEYFSRKYGARLSAHIDGYAEFNPAQKVLFDIVLMSRCKNIFHGFSVFSSIASWIGNVPSLTVSDLISNNEIVTLTRDFVSYENAEISSEQKSCSVLHVLIRYRNLLRSDDVTSFIDYGILVDPANPVYSVLKAHHLYHEGREGEAEAVLLNKLQSRKDLDMIWLLSETRHYNVIQRYLPDIRIQADCGWPIAALCTAFRAKSVGDLGEAKRYAGIYLKTRASLRTALDAEVTDI